MNNCVSFWEEECDTLSTFSSMVGHSSSDMCHISSPQLALQFNDIALDTWNSKEPYREEICPFRDKDVTSCVSTEGLVKSHMGSVDCA